MTTRTENFARPKSLRDMLLIMERLSSHHNFRKYVLQDLKQEVLYWFNAEAVAKNANNIESIYSTEGKLDDAIKACDNLLSNISVTTDIEHSSVITSSLADFIYDLYGSLYHLYFMADSIHFQQVNGGIWSSLYAQNTNNLNMWLTDSSYESGKTTDETNELTLPKGFRHANLEHNTGRNIVGSQWNVANLVKLNGTGNLQYAIRYMLTLGPWSNAKTAHAVQFLKEFCEKVDSDFFNNLSYNNITPEDLKVKCNPLKNNLEDLKKQFYLISDNAMLYTNVFIKERYGDYISWIASNINGLNGSLTAMKNNCPKWNKDNIDKGVTSGPYMFGYSFKNNDWRTAPNCNALIAEINKVQGQNSNQSLQALKQFFKEKNLDVDSATPPVKPLFWHERIENEAGTGIHHHEECRRCDQLSHHASLPEAKDAINVKDLTLMPLAFMLLFLFIRIF